MKLRFLLGLFATLLTISLMTSCSEDTPEPTPDPEPTPMDTTTMEPTDNLPVAPDFALSLAGGGSVTKDDFADKTLVIFFFGNGCPPCKGVAPSIESQLKKAFADKSNFAIIGVDLWDGSESRVDGFKSQTGVTFPLALEGSGMGSAYGSTYDRLVVINSKGKIAFQDNGRTAANALDEVVAKVHQLTSN